MEEVAYLANMAFLGDDEVGLEMQLVLADDDNAPTPLDVPEITNQGEAVYIVDWGYDGIFHRRLAVERNRDIYVHFASYIYHIVGNR